MAKIPSVEGIVKKACDDALDKVTVEIAGYGEMRLRDFIRCIADDEINVSGRGRWIRDEDTYAGSGVSNFKCSVCGKFGGTWLSEIAEDHRYRFCPWCGSVMWKEGNDD